MGINLKIFFTLFLTGMCLQAMAQDKLFTRTGTIKFVSEAPLENIEATNRQVASIIDKKTGEMRVIATIKSFYFERAAMQEHFNEKYMESDKYPTASFTGRITNLQDINFLKDGKYDATVLGDLTIHGVIHQQIVKATITVAGGQVSATASFPVVVQDYQITVPRIVRDNIARQVEVSVVMKYELINK